LGTRAQRFIADFFTSAVQHDPGTSRAIGRDPRQLTPAQLEAFGHAAKTPLQALRATCLAHLGTAPKVRQCAASACPAWPFRMGTHPFKKKIRTDERTKTGGRGAPGWRAGGPDREARPSKKFRREVEEPMTGRAGAKVVAMKDFEQGEAMAAVWAMVIFIGAAMAFVALILALSHSPVWVRTLMGAGLLVVLVGVFLINYPQTRNNVSRETRGNIIALPKPRRPF
jgi:hypothetical protein